MKCKECMGKRDKTYIEWESFALGMAFGAVVAFFLYLLILL